VTLLTFFLYSLRLFLENRNFYENVCKLSTKQQQINTSQTNIKERRKKDGIKAQIRAGEEDCKAWQEED
jgi:hypothetical protein